MTVVNQSIGRVIRHRNDYAAIALLDKRFSEANIKDNLPKWIKDAGIEICDHFPESMLLISKVNYIIKFLIILTNIKIYQVFFTI